MLTRGRTLPRRGLPPTGFDPVGEVARSMPLGLIDGGPFRPFSRAISACWAATVCFSAATSPSNWITSSLSWVGDRESRSGGGGTATLNRKSTPLRIEKIRPGAHLPSSVTFWTRPLKRCSKAPSGLLRHAVARVFCRGYDAELEDAVGVQAPTAASR